MTHAIREAGTLKTVFFFENADQISEDGVETFARILARTYHDAYLDIDIDFASSVFIVSCNNWSGTGSPSTMEQEKMSRTRRARPVSSMAARSSELHWGGMDSKFWK